MAFEFGKIAETFKAALANPELDKIEKETRKALDEEKKSPGHSKLAVSYLDRALPKLEVDLEELKVPQGEWEGIKTKYKESFEKATKGMQDEAIVASFEGKRLNNFLDSFAKYGKLDAIIAECKKEESGKPLIQLIRFIQANSSLFEGFGLGSGSFLAMLGVEKEGDEKTKPSAPPSNLNTKAAAADKVIQENKNKGKEKAPTDTETKKPDEITGKAPTYRHRAQGGEKYKVNPENAEKLNPAEFKKRFEATKDRHARNMLVLQQVAAGNAKPNFETITITGKTGKKLEMDVDKSGLRVCGMEVQLDGPTAMAAAELTGCTLPTPWISDQVFEQAKRTGGFIPFIDAPQIAAERKMTWDKDRPDGNWMMSPEFAITRNEMLRRARKSDDQLVAGYFKDIVHPTPGKSKPGYINIYGGKRADGSNIQDIGNHHELSYSDYPQQVRRVRKQVRYEGQTMELTEFYKKTEFAKEFGFEAQALMGYPYPPELQTYVNQQKNKQS